MAIVTRNSPAATDYSPSSNWVVNDVNNRVLGLWFKTTELLEIEIERSREDFREENSWKAEHLSSIQSIMEEGIHMTLELRETERKMEECRQLVITQLFQSFRDNLGSTGDPCKELEELHKKVKEAQNLTFLQDFQAEESRFKVQISSSLLAYTERLSTNRSLFDDRAKKIKNLQETLTTQLGEAVKLHTAYLKEKEDSFNQSIRLREIEGREEQDAFERKMRVAEFHQRENQAALERFRVITDLALKNQEQQFNHIRQLMSPSAGASSSQGTVGESVSTKAKIQSPQ